MAVEFADIFFHQEVGILFGCTNAHGNWSRSNFEILNFKNVQISDKKSILELSGKESLAIVESVNAMLGKAAKEEIKGRGNYFDERSMIDAESSETANLLSTRRFNNTVGVSPVTVNPQGEVIQ